MLAVPFLVLLVQNAFVSAQGRSSNLLHRDKLKFNELNLFLLLDSLQNSRVAANIFILGFLLSPPALLFHLSGHLLLALL